MALECVTTAIVQSRGGTKEHRARGAWGGTRTCSSLPARVAVATGWRASAACVAGQSTLLAVVASAVGSLACSSEASIVSIPQAAPQFFDDGFTAPALDSSVFEPDPFPTEVQTFAVCTEASDVSFDSYAVSSATIAAVGQVVYAWLSTEEASAATAEVVPLGGSMEWRDSLEAAAPNAAQSERARFAQTFTSFGRVTWPNAWATRLLTHEVGPQLLRLQLRRDARWLVVNGQGTVVVDAQGTPIASEIAAANPELIAGVFLESPEVSDGNCGPAHARSMVVTNPAVVESWSIGAADVVARVNDDVGHVQGLLKWMRECSFDVDVATWTRASACSNYAGSDDEVGQYERGLALATAAYRPGTHELALLVDTLTSDLRRWATAPVVVQSAVVPVADGGVDEPDAAADAGEAVSSGSPSSVDVDASAGGDASLATQVETQTLGNSDASIGADGGTP